MRPAHQGESAESLPPRTGRETKGFVCTKIDGSLPPRTGEGGPLAVDEGPDDRHPRSAQVPQYAARRSLYGGEDRSPARRDPHPSSGLRGTPDATFPRPRGKAAPCISLNKIQTRRSPPANTIPGRGGEGRERREKRREKREKKKCRSARFQIGRRRRHLKMPSPADGGRGTACGG